MNKHAKIGNNSEMANHVGIPNLVSEVSCALCSARKSVPRSSVYTSFQPYGAAMANETWKFVQAKSKQAMKQVLGIKDEAARMKVTPPLAVAPLAHGDDMRWNPNDDGINFNP